MLSKVWSGRQSTLVRFSQIMLQCSVDITLDSDVMYLSTAVKIEVMETVHLMVDDITRELLYKWMPP